MASQQLVEIILKAQDQASNTAKKVDESIKNISKSSGLLSKIPGFDTLKTKMGSVASSIDGKFGGALSRARTRITTFGNSIKSVSSTVKGKFTGAIDGVRNRLTSFGNGARNAAGSLNFLKGAASMAVGMIGYDLVTSLMESTRASMNARQGIQAFGSRLSMSGEEVSKFQSDLDELQGTFKKVDMDVVGQQAMDMAYRLGLPKSSLTELTETSAIFTDAMQRNGRSAEDATLALADAMDGEFRRLKEIGISQDDLMKNGWSGDINDKTGLLNAMNKALKEQHYDELAKSVDSLDDAWQVLSITLGNLMESILLPITPAIVGVINGFINLINGIKSAWSGLPDFAQLGIGIGLVAGAIALVAGVLWTTYIPAWMTAAAATWAALSPILVPLLAIAAAIGLLVAAVYEVGKAFGWWSDVGGMMDAISAGIQRLWNAFINHPDVQALISAISSAISTLWSWITQAGQAVLEFFGVTSSGNFDIVRALIDGIGFAWQAMTAPIRMVIGLVQWVINVFNQFTTGQMTLQGTLVMIWNAITTSLTSIFGLIIGKVVAFGARMLASAIQAGRQLVNGVINQARTLPGKLYSLLLSVVGKITGAIAAWVSAAKSKVQSVISAITGPFSGVVGAISSALSGVVSAITAPFQAAWDTVKPIIDSIKSGMDFIGNLSFGGEPAYGGEVLPSATVNPISANTYTVEADNSPIVIEDNVKVTLDLQNVPSTINTNQLITALTDKTVLSALTGNRDFQNLDAKVKQRIDLKHNRARGV